ncbi:MAG: flagellar hook-length control protein FliK [Nitrospiraceae bacterium]
MAIGFLIPSINDSTAQPSSSAMNGTGQTQQGPQCEVFSAFLKDAIKHTDDEQASSLSDAGNPGEPTPVTAVGDQATGPALIGIVIVSFSQVPDNQKIASTVADRADSLPIADANASVDSNSSSSPTGPPVENIASIPLLLLNPTFVAPSDDGTLGHEPVANTPSQLKTTDSSNASLPQPALNPDSANEVPATQSASPTTNKPASRNGRGAPVNLAPVPPEQPLGDSTLPGTLPPGSLTSNQKPIPVMEQQGGGSFPSAAYVNGNAQPLDGPSTDNRPSSTVQEQGEQETTVPGQSVSVRLVGGSGGGGRDPFGSSAQGGGEGTTVHSHSDEAPESGMRGTQSTLFSDQFTSARQTQPLPQGASTSVLTPAADQLKLTQAFLGEDHPATMTAHRGMTQTVQVDLPSHEAGPLSVRISMMDQTVHTQVTTDRSDLGAILIGRQDQLQQNLTKSGLELGQFQVHINQDGRQDAFPDRQSRRHGGAPEQQPSSQGHGEQSHDQERPNHRPLRALSLFA